MTTLSVNGNTLTVEAEPDTPLLWVLRDELKLSGTKFGCGIAQCGACTVHLDGLPRRSCVAPISSLEGGKVVTIEGLDTKEGRALQKAWAALDVPQCGYCQSGQIMTAAALLAEIPKPTDADIDAALAGNICRCATYVRIRAAIHLAANQLRP
jgi:isoquinoline 1-oxidoreductase alpha subunit